MASFTHRNRKNLFIFFELDTWWRHLSAKSTLGDCLFGVLKLTRNVDPGKYGYSSFAIGFDTHSEFLLPDGEFGKNIVVVDVDSSLSVHADNRKQDILVLISAADNRKKDILVLGEGTTDGLDITAATVKDKYSVNITTSRKKICLKNVYATMPQTIFYMV